MRERERERDGQNEGGQRMMSWAMSLARIAHRGEEAEVKRNKKKK